MKDFTGNTDTSVKKKTEDEKDQSDIIKKAFGIQSYYLIYPYTRYIKEITATMLPDVIIHYNSSPQELKNTLTKIVSEEFKGSIESSSKLYISLSVSKETENSDYILGSATPLKQAVIKIGEKGSLIYAPEVEHEINSKKTPPGKTILIRAAQRSLWSWVTLVHNVLIIIDKNLKTITYKDSYGPNNMTPSYKKLFEQFDWREYKFIESAVLQQHKEDHCHCSIFTLENIWNSFYELRY